MINHPYVGIRHPLRFAAWTWMLSEACWRGTNAEIGGKPVALERGQFAHSLRFMAEKTGMTLKQIRVFLDGLEEREMVSKTGTPGGKSLTVVTICNYDKYQDDAEEKGTPDDKQRAHQGHTKGTEKKKERKKEGNNPPKSPQGESSPIEILSGVIPPDLAVDFVAHRKGMKKPLTARAAQIIAKKLDGCANPVGVVENSIANGWQGIFPEKAKAQEAASGWI